MEFQYSSIVDSSTYDTEGLCDGIDLRKSNFAFLEDRGIVRAQQDWAKYVGPLHDNLFRGSMGPRYSYISVGIPECLPERLEILAYANEFGFLYDDIFEAITDPEKSTIENNKLLGAFHEGVRSGQIIQDPESERGGWRKMQSKILHDLLAIDRIGAINIVKAWAEYNQQQHRNFSTLEEYFPYRLKNAAARIWTEFILFAMGLKLSAPERAKAEDLTRPAYFALVLQNDLYSWEREYREAQAQALNDEQSQSIDVTNMMNAIWVLMQEHNHLDIAGAQELCRIKIKQYTTEYIQIVENVKGDQSLSVDLVKYVEALKYDIVGQAAWCMTCPRNHPDISFTEEQLEWMRGGVLPESGTPNSEALKARSALSDSATRMPIVASNRKMSLAKSHSGTEH